MAINQNIVQGKWLEIKGDIQKSWGKLTNDDLDKTKGDMKSVAGLIQRHYGEAQEAKEKQTSQLTEIYNKYSNINDEKVDEAKGHLKV